MTAIFAWLRVRMIPREVRIAREKRRLQEAIREAGGSRKVALSAVAIYFRGQTP